MSEKEDITESTGISEASEDERKFILNTGEIVAYLVRARLAGEDPGKLAYGFHRALADASYTARILLEIDEACMIRHPSLDVYQNPKSRDSEIYISYTDHDKFVSREFVSKERLMKDRTMVSTMCPICRCPAKRKIRWFSTNNSKVYYSLALCHEHGPVAGKIRIRKTDEGKYFGVKTLKAEDTEAADEIREKHESLRRRKMLRSQEKI